MDMTLFVDFVSFRGTAVFIARKIRIRALPCCKVSSENCHACDDFYIAISHTVDQSFHIEISFNHAFHLVLGTKLSKLLCLIYRGFGKTSRFQEKVHKEVAPETN